jgi:hypothetical protein
VAAVSAKEKVRARETEKEMGRVMETAREKVSEKVRVKGMATASESESASASEPGRGREQVQVWALDWVWAPDWVWASARGRQAEDWALVPAAKSAEAAATAAWKQGTVRRSHPLPRRSPRRPPHRRRPAIPAAPSLTPPRNPRGRQALRPRRQP